MAKMSIQGICLATVSLLVVLTSGFAAGETEIDKCIEKVVEASKAVSIPEDIIEYGLAMEQESDSGVDAVASKYPESSCDHIMEKMYSILDDTGCEMLFDDDKPDQKLDSFYQSESIKNILKALDICTMDEISDDELIALSDDECIDRLRNATKNFQLPESVVNFPPFDGNSSSLENNFSELDCYYVDRFRSRILGDLENTDCIRFLYSEAAEDKANAINDFLPEDKRQGFSMLIDFCDGLYLKNEEADYPDAATDDEEPQVEVDESS